MTCYVIVYMSEIDKGVQTTQQDDDKFAERVEVLIHADATFGGLVIDSLVSEIEFGYQRKGSVLYRAARLTVTAQTKTLLPSNT